MRFKNPTDSKYITNFMRSTEALMNSLSVDEFINYLEIHAILDDCIDEYIDGSVIKCFVFIFNESRHLHKTFLVTLDRRVFYWRTVSDKIELI